MRESFVPRRSLPETSSDQTSLYSSLSSWNLPLRVGSARLLVVKSEALRNSSPDVYPKWGPYGWHLRDRPDRDDRAVHITSLRSFNDNARSQATNRPLRGSTGSCRACQKGFSLDRVIRSRINSSRACRFSGYLGSRSLRPRRIDTGNRNVRLAGSFAVIAWTAIPPPSGNRSETI